MRTGIHFHGKLLEMTILPAVVILRVTASDKTRELLNAFIGEDPKPAILPEVEVTVATE